MLMSNRTWASVILKSMLSSQLCVPSQARLWKGQGSCWYLSHCRQPCAQQFPSPPPAAVSLTVSRSCQLTPSSRSLHSATVTPTATASCAASVTELLPATRTDAHCCLPGLGLHRAPAAFFRSALSVAADGVYSGLDSAGRGPRPFVL